MLHRFTVLLAFASSVSWALPVVRREVPQEHSHESILVSANRNLKLDNPDQIVDAVFSLLGNAAASAGLGRIQDPTCLQLAVADRAFTNAKARNDVQGMTDALLFRALEKNTGRVGLASDPCTSIQAVNPEIAAIQQHQDPASPNAAQINKAIALELAKQIKAIGGNPLDALKAGTFSPGNLNDATGKGNSCNELDDPVGCIFTQNLLVPDATEEEILAAAGDVAQAPPAQETGAADTCPAPTTVTVTVAPTPTATGGGAAATTPCAENVTRTVTNTITVTPTAAATQTQAPAITKAASLAGNLQRFAGALGQAHAPTVSAGGRGFQVEGSDSFLNIAAAIGRSCDIQHNRCANVANSAAGRAAGLTVGQCDQQNNACRAANA